MITRFQFIGKKRAKITQEMEEDPLMCAYVYLIEVGDRSVRIGAPMAASTLPSNLELISAVQLILGRQVHLTEQPSLAIEDFDEYKVLRRWRTYYLAALD